MTRPRSSCTSAWNGRVSAVAVMASSRMRGDHSGRGTPARKTPDAALRPRRDRARDREPALQRELVLHVAVLVERQARGHGLVPREPHAREPRRARAPLDLAAAAEGPLHVRAVDRAGRRRLLLERL